jgi:hypothetical protein
LEAKINLLIHADPGARSGFVAAWLTDRLTKLAFDSGASLKPRFSKIHKIGDSVDPFACIGTLNSISNFAGIKIRITPSISSIDLHLLLFLKKTKELTYFSQHEYLFETFSKLTTTAHDWFDQNKIIDYNYYDIVLDFTDTFNKEFMIDLYKKVVGVNPTDDMIDMLVETNNLNNILIDKNHACSITKLCLEEEHRLGLKEENRFWSIIDVYNSTPVDQLYDTVSRLIVPQNYSILL